MGRGGVGAQILPSYEERKRIRRMYYFLLRDKGRRCYSLPGRDLSLHSAGHPFARIPFGILSNMLFEHPLHVLFPFPKYYPKLSSQKPDEPVRITV